MSDPDENKLGKLAGEYERWYQLGIDSQNPGNILTAVSYLNLMMKEDASLVRDSELLGFVASGYYDAVIMFAQEGREKEVKDATKNALEYAKKGLSVDPNDFTCQSVIAYIASDNVLHLNLDSGDLKPNLGGVVGVFDTLSRWTNAGAAAGYVKASKSKYLGELKRLCEIFDMHIRSGGYLAQDYLEESNHIFKHADFCKGQNLGEPTKMFRQILSAKPSALIYPDDDDEFKKLLAEEVDRIQTFVRATLA